MYVHAMLFDLLANGLNCLDVVDGLKSIYEHVQDERIGQLGVYVARLL
jgi:hypothetical protein